MKAGSLFGINEFVTVVDEGSFTAAAEELGVSRVRVSQVIAELEKRIGGQLLQRSTRSMCLTELGERFYERCQRGLHLIGAAFEQAAEDRNTVAGTIRINSVGGLFGEQILAPLLLEFMQLYPQVRIELDFSSTQVDLISERYDLALRMGELESSNLRARLLATYPTYTVAAREYIERCGMPKTPSDLVNHNIISGTIRKWIYKPRKQGKDKIVDITSATTLWCPNGYVCRQAALNGSGIARMPSYYVDEDLDSGRLVPLLSDWQHGKSKVSAVYSDSKYRLSRMHVLISHLADNLGGRP